jgi:hypothetical protein
MKQGETIARDMLAAGVNPDEVRAAFLQQFGRDLDPATPAAPPGIAPEAAAVTAEAQAIDQAFPPGKAKDFEIPSLTELAKKVSEATGRAIGQEEVFAKREWVGRILESIGPTAALGSDLAECFVKVDAHWNSLNESGRQLQIVDTRAQLAQRYGDQLPAKLLLAREMVMDLEKRHPGTVQFIIASGVGNDAGCIARLISQAERLALKRGIPTTIQKGS